MTSWLGRKLESAVNFVSRTSEEIGENTGFKLGRNIFRFLFGLPLGVTRLLVVDAPIHLAIFTARIAHTTTFATAWKNIFGTKVDPFYTGLSDAAKAMTSNFVKGFMFGPYLETASWAKEQLAEMEAENYGSTKGDPTSPENIVVKNPARINPFIQQEMYRVDTGKVDDLGRPSSNGVKPTSATLLAVSQVKNR